MTLADDVLKNEKDIVKLNAKIQRLIRRIPQNILQPPESTTYSGTRVRPDDLWEHLTYNRAKPTLAAAMTIIKTEYNIADAHDARLEAQISDYLSWMYRRNN